jgi:spore germination cell wall hydrolase CwlJ-like protein
MKGNTMWKVLCGMLVLWFVISLFKTEEPVKPVVQVEPVVTKKEVSKQITPPKLLNKPHEDEYECLVMNIFFEAGGESIEGMRAVAAVTLNRLFHPAYPKTICDVVFQPWQFSWTLARQAPQLPLHAYTGAPGLVARETIQRAVEGGTWDNTGGALWFHATYISKPYWIKGKEQVAQIGRHIFYRE